MKRKTFYFLIILIATYLSGCQTVVYHSDPFYNDDGGEHFPYVQFPLIKPYYVWRSRSSSPWMLDLQNGLWVDTPEMSYLYQVNGLEKISVQSGVIMAYSPYINEQMSPSIQDNYCHWFVIVTDKKINMCFHDEHAFQTHIQKLGIQNPEWQDPTDAFKQFVNTGCLSWIPDCK